MKQNTSPADIARQTLIQLAKNSLPPTPDNYKTAYNKIAGVEDNDFAPVTQTLQKVLANTSQDDPKRLSANKEIAAAIKTQNWETLEKQLTQLLTTTANTANWAVLIRNLIKKLETGHKGITLSRKKEGLSRVLVNFSKDPNVLAEKINALMQSWGHDVSKMESSEPASLPFPAHVAARQEAAPNATATSDHTATKPDTSAITLKDMLIRTLDLALIPLLANSPEIAKKAHAVLDNLRSNPDEKTLVKCSNELKGILLTVETEHENQLAMNKSIIDLLTLMSNSMAEIVGEDEWVNGQIKIVNDVLSKPIDINGLHNAESSLKELIHKQSNLKPAIQDSKELIKQMAETFVSRLVDITETTDDYHQKVEEHQRKLHSIKGIDELNSVLKNVLEDTREIGLTIQRTREEFHDSQERVNQAEKKIQELTSVLEYINDVANEDYLTGTLNRRGMEDALEREFSRADRHHTALSIAMMDIDHFKRLNDSLGHHTGDEALVHFTNVIKAVKRTTDVLARYGGEEFLIILPNTVESDAIKVMQRVQRALTKQFFMHSNERVVITFSAGVAQRMPDETPDNIIPRADAALFEAKNTGRNRVVGAQSTDIDPSTMIANTETDNKPNQTK